MEIEPKYIKIRDLLKGFVNDPEKGVYAYDGKLNIRPPYQREFRYDEKQQQAVIQTILKGFPLNIMYWSVCEDGSYEMIDGQQRTLSICGYYWEHAFNIKIDKRDVLYYGNLTKEEKEKFLNYELMVYFCTGTDKERLDWFRVINIAGERLLEQELRNAVYTGPFISDARRYFSKNQCPAYAMGQNYMKGTPIRQEYLETILAWAARHDGINGANPIDQYMALHQKDPNVEKLWNYYLQIITWVKKTFTKYRKEMKGLDWGEMYDRFGTKDVDPNELEKRIGKLMEDDEILKKSGIYRYVLSDDLRDLSFRIFDKKQKREAYERQKGICPLCGKHFELEEMEADHIKPWSKGGTTVADNCEMLCRDCNRTKGNKY